MTYKAQNDIIILVRSKTYKYPRKGRKEDDMEMHMSEAARLIIGLRARGWDEKDINDFILFIETGDEKYKPGNKEK